MADHSETLEDEEIYGMTYDWQDAREYSSVEMLRHAGRHLRQSCICIKYVLRLYSAVVHKEKTSGSTCDVFFLLQRTSKQNTDLCVMNLFVSMHVHYILFTFSSAYF